MRKYIDAIGRILYTIFAAEVGRIVNLFIFLIL